MNGHVNSDKTDYDRVGMDGTDLEQGMTLKKEYLNLRYIMN